MNPERWAEVDAFFNAALIAPDATLEQALADNARAGLPAIDVSLAQGKLLQLLAQAQGARRILEIGTLGGFSTIWLARALGEGGLLVTLEKEALHAEVARRNLQRAGVAGKVTVIVGPALESLPKVASDFPGAFDLVFIDADKPSTPEYFDWAVRLSRPGTLIVTDNVVRKGAVVEADSTDASVQGMRRFVRMLENDKRVSSTVVQTVGPKGYDGFILSRVA